MNCFSYRNGAAWNHFTEGEIRRYFSNHFKIPETKEDTFTVKVSGQKLYFYSTLMEAKDRSG